MKLSIRSLSTFLGGVLFVAFASFAAPNCQPSGGDPGGPGGGEEGTGGKGTGGNNETGGSGGSDEGTGGNDNTGGKGTGGKGTGGKDTGGSAGGGSGGSAGSGGTTSGSGGSGSGGTTTSGSGGTTTPTGGTTGSSGRLCAPKTASTPAVSSTGGLACPGGLCTVDTYAGYMYPYSDGTSTICLGTDSLCASGTTGAGDTAGKIWGAGVGFNLDKADPPTAVQLSGTGLTYALSALPSQGMRAQVTEGSTDYCVKLTSASGTVAWTDFNTACWDDSGDALTGAPKTPHVGFQVTAATASGTFDFCVKSVAFK